MGASVTTNLAGTHQFPIRKLSLWWAAVFNEVKFWSAFPVFTAFLQMCILPQSLPFKTKRHSILYSSSCGGETAQREWGFPPWFYASLYGTCMFGLCAELVRVEKGTEAELLFDTVCVTCSSFANLWWGRRCKEHWKMLVWRDLENP